MTEATSTHSKQRRLKVLMSAYACEPGRGSEPGVGWNLAKAMAAHHDVWVLTRANNRAVIEAEIHERPINGLSFIYYDLPPWAAWWKRGGRGVQLYYYLWQLGAIRAARAAHRSVAFDLAHHVTFVKYWAPAAAAFVGVPFVWGPVGGGESMPRAFVADLSWHSRMYECARLLARAVGERDPLARATARRASIALATTSESASRMRTMTQVEVRELPEVALSAQELIVLGSTSEATNSRELSFVSVGRLLGWKGYHLSLLAFAKAGLERYRYTIIGSGPEAPALARLANELGISARVDFVGQLQRSEVLARLSAATAFVHPSLHDSGGWATIEAMAAGVPVICLDIGGPGVQVDAHTGMKIAPVSRDQVVADLAIAMHDVAANATLRSELGRRARLVVADRFEWTERSRIIDGVYFEVIQHGLGHGSGVPV